MEKIEFNPTAAIAGKIRKTSIEWMMKKMIHEEMRKKIIKTCKKEMGVPKNATHMMWGKA